MKQYQHTNNANITVSRAVPSTPVQDTTARAVVEQLQHKVDYQSRKIARLESQLEQLAAIVQRQR